MKEIEPKVDTLPESKLFDSEATLLCSDIRKFDVGLLPSENPLLPSRFLAVQKTDHADAAMIFHP
jgi:hypothetical protein